MSTSTRSSSNVGATLVELLVALGIGALIIGVVILAHHSLTRNAAGQLDRLNMEEAAHRTIDAFREDLLQLFVTTASPDCGITLENSATNLVLLGFCRWERLTDRDALFTNRLERVEFQPVTGTNRYAWVQVRRALTGPDAAKPSVTNRLDGIWPRVLVHLHDGSRWQTNWSATTDARPRAARITLLDATHQPAYETMLVIPSGLAVTSTILRAGSATVASP